MSISSTTMRDYLDTVMEGIYISLSVRLCIGQHSQYTATQPSDGAQLLPKVAPNYMKMFNNCYFLQEERLLKQAVAIDVIGKFIKAA